MRLTVTAVVMVFCVLNPCSAHAAEPYRYGNLEAKIASGWTATPLVSPGITLITFVRDADNAKPKPAPTLIWLETTPLVDASPTVLVNSVVNAIGLRTTERRSEYNDPDVHQVVMDALVDEPGCKRRYTPSVRGRNFTCWGFIAAPPVFSAMDGEKLPLTVFRDGSPVYNRNATTKNELPAAASVLARAGNDALTQQMVTDSLELAQFLAATTFSRAEKQQMRQLMIDEYASGSNVERVAYKRVSTLMEQLGSADAVKRAEIRRDMLKQIWFDSRKIEKQSPLVNLVHKYNPILGADEKLDLVAPRAAFDALLASNSFVAGRAGFSPPTPAERDQFAEEIKRTYSTLNERQKRYLSNGEVSWLKLIKVWQSWDETAQKKHLRLVGFEGINSEEQVSQVARNLEHWAGIDASVQQVKKLIGLQGNDLAQQHLRGLLNSN